jgi:hypothetical protein
MWRMPDDPTSRYNFPGDTGIYEPRTYLDTREHVGYNHLNPLQSVYVANVAGGISGNPQSRTIERRFSPIPWSIFVPDTYDLDSNNLNRSSVEPTTIGIGSLGDTLPTKPNGDTPTAATPTIVTPSGSVVTNDPVTGEPVVVDSGNNNTKTPKGKKSPKGKDSKGYRDPSDIDWSGVGVNALGLLAGYNQYVRGKKGQLRRPDIYSRNPYQRQALTTLAGLRESAYPAMRANADAARLADYALRN